MPAEPVAASALAYLEYTSKVTCRHGSKQSILARPVRVMQIMHGNKGDSWRG